MKLRLSSIVFGMTLSVAFLLVPSQVYAATTKGGYPICFKKEWLSELISFLAANDHGSYEAYFNSEKCVMAKGGIRVTITESPGVFGTTAGFVANGVKGWTLREGINY